MVELCQHVFADVLALVREQDPDIVVLEEGIARHTADWKAAKARDDRESLRTIATARRALRQQWRERVWAVRDKNKKHIQQEFLARLNIMKKESAIYGLRKEAVDRGLFWATASEVMRRARQAFDKSLNRLQRVRFQSWSERDQDTLTIQITKSGGITVEELHNGSHPELCIEPLLAHPGPRPKSKSYTPFRIRIAPSPEGKGKRGLNATGTVYWHRELPPDARITYARLVRRRIASHWRSYLQLVFSVKRPIATIDCLPQRGITGIDLNWHYDDEEHGRRIAAVSEDGQTGRLIHLDTRHGADLETVDCLNETRSRWRDEIVDGLRAVDWSDAPEVLQPLADDLRRHPRAQEIAQSRLARYVNDWKRECPKWKTPILLDAEDWRKRDKRLWETTSHLRRKAIKRRDKRYQAIARDLVASSSLLLIDRPDLKRAAIVKNEHSGRHNELGAAARSGRHEVALSRLENWITTKAAEAGTHVVRVQGRTTWKCSACGIEVKKPEDAATRTWACPGCGVVHDRDINAACNVRQVAEARQEEIEAAVSKADERVKRKLDRRSKRKEARTGGLKARHQRASAPVATQTPTALATDKDISLQDVTLSGAAHSDE
jgi:hypothetical protein